jgi:hypothetical protein
VAVGVLGLLGPGGDAMLLPDWQSLLLVVGGVGAGLWSLRAVLEQDYRERADRSAAEAGRKRGTGG